MFNVMEVSKEIWWLGASDRRLELFENAYPVPNGMSYNNYVIMDEKTCLMDGIDSSVLGQFLDNLEHVLDGRPLDYMVVQHMEPDHCFCIPQLLAKYPELKIVASAKAIQMIDQFYHIKVDGIEIKEGDTLDLGSHQLTFYAAPMVHWPEVMVTYDTTSKVLFSADAFGEFGALSGNLFADEVDWERDWADEARRYYTNIVGKYGMQVMNLLKKASTLEIKMLLPLHGHVWRQDFEKILSRYEKWASYTPEKNSVAIFYGSVYGNTANAADVLATKLAQAGVKDIRVFDVSKTPVSECLSRAFEYGTLVFASSTYNAEIFDYMHQFLVDLKNHNLANRTVGIIENGSWAATAGKKISETVSALKNMKILEPMVSLKSSLDENSLANLDTLAEEIRKSL